ncbi:MAG: CPBP family intramembrane metalloprotease [Planctomycetes bacterium]|nr:CPBP family intramembrane metalloprotease [Planctomycetota bacterium]
MLEQFDGAVGVPGLLWIIFLGVLLPWSVWKNTRLSSRRPLLERGKYMAIAATQLAIFTAVGIVVAHFEHLELFPAYAFRWAHLVAGLAALALFVGVNWRRWEQKVKSGERRVHLVSPRTPRELALWTCVCVAAGVGEEILYRAVLTTLVWRITDNAAVAIVIAVVAFGLAHLHQGWSGAAVTALFALIAHALVGFTHTLVIAMVVHFTYDLIAGLRYASLVKRFGYKPAEPAT